MSNALPPVDPNVVLPPRFAAAAAAADALHKQVYGDQNAPAEPPAAPVEPPAEPPAAAAPAEPAPAEPPAPPPAAPPAEPPATPPADNDVSPDQWRHRYLSMKGRYDQASIQIGHLQEQMTALGDELMRTQQLVRQAPPERQQPKPTPQKHITDKDTETYGEDLIDVARRAALDAVSPEIEGLKGENQQLKQKLTQTAKQTMYDQLSQAVPNWRQINQHPRFKAWVSLPDVYSGSVRNKLLNAAVQAADAPRVIAFFNGFLREEQATGQSPQPTPAPAAAPAPRDPALDLAGLAAPGRAKPASGDSHVPAQKPIYNRTQIAEFYRDVRQGRYAGREADKAKEEAAIFLAQREGRVRG